MLLRSCSLAVLFAMAAFAQTVPPVIVTHPPPVTYAKSERILRDMLKTYRQDESAVCAIRLTEVPVSKNTKPMRVLRPSGAVEPMPMVPLPAPPCKEEKR
jgi:hypothetical protein